MDDRSHAQASASRWLLLIHQLPAKPAYFRVKIWRRLQALGAVAVKNAVYALPANEQTQEDFEWLLREISEGGGEATLCEARFVEGLSDQEVRALFDRARDEDYDAIAKEARSIGAELGEEPPPERRAEVKGSSRGSESASPRSWGSTSSAQTARAPRRAACGAGESCRRAGQRRVARSNLE